jgi:phenylacetate-coenzyme A ligase PaaK-like adenylate-forming protein
MTYRMAASIDIGLYRVLRLEAATPLPAMVEALNRHQFELYAMTDAGIIGSHCDRHSGIHLFEDQAVVEVVDERDRPVPAGRVGHKLLVTNLVTLTQPLIRLQDERDTAGKFKLVESRLSRPAARVP